MQPILAIKPGPKPNKIDGTPDKRRRVTPEVQPKHPDLKPHIHKPGDSKPPKKTQKPMLAVLLGNDRKSTQQGV